MTTPALEEAFQRHRNNLENRVHSRIYQMSIERSLPKRVYPKKLYGDIVFEDPKTPKPFFDYVADTLDEMIRMCDEALAYDPLSSLL